MEAIHRYFFQYTGVFIVIIWLLLQHVSVQRDHIQVINISKIIKKGHLVMGGFYINEISYVHINVLHERLIGVCIDVDFPLQILW
jgi:hypothetical protein